MNKSELLNLPLNTKKSSKSKFTEKRNPYKKYLNAKWKWTDIFTEIDNKESSIKNISKKYNINYVTLRQKYSYYKNKKLKKPNEENRGGSKRKEN